MVRCVAHFSYNLCDVSYDQLCVQGSSVSNSTQMMVVLSNKSVVNKLLYKQTYSSLDLMIDSQQTYLIHTSVLPDILEYIHQMHKKSSVDFKYDLRPYTLHVGETTFDMAIVFVTITNKEVIHDIIHFIGFCQFTKQWEYYLFRRKTLYIDLDQTHVLEKFIEMHNLGKSIISTEVEPGINTNQSQIKIVTFSEEVHYFFLLHMFSEFYKSKQLKTFNNWHYYVNYAFDWLQPTRLSQLNNTLENERFFFGLHTFFDCLRENPLNILDLCSMKLAFCEQILMNSSAKLAARIDEMISTLLKKAKCNGYIQDGEFDFHGYAEKQNLKQTKTMLSGYFLYTFQNYFQSIKLDSSTDFRDILLRIIKLIDPQNLLLELRGNPNITFKIDAEHFSGMDAKLFSNILQCGNVNILQLNAKARWFNSNEPFVSDARNSNAIILLLDADQLFMENFIKSLNSMANAKNLQIFLMKPNLQSFSIFKNVNVAKIHFYDTTLTSTVLEELMESNCYRNTLIWFQNIKINNDVHTWLLFIRFNFKMATIIEEEDTWQNLFDAVVLHINHLRNGAEFSTDLQFNEFQLHNLSIRTINDKEINFTSFKFTIDESNTKLEIKHCLSNRHIDLFDLKNELDFLPEEDDGSCYEFYQ